MKLILNGEEKYVEDMREIPVKLYRKPILYLLIIGFLGIGVNVSFCQVRSTSNMRITYVGNEGVLIEGGGKKVLIDGLHCKYKPAYQHLEKQDIEAAEQGKPPFDDIDLLLVTHIHQDHFNSRSVGVYLENNPDAAVVAPQQVTDSLKQKYENFTSIASRVKAVTPAPGTAEFITQNGIRVNILRLDHTNKSFDWVQNLGFLVTMNGNTVLHIGDAAMSDENFTPFKLVEKNIDVACIPYWFLLYPSGQQIIRDQIQADHLVGIHIDPRKKEEYVKRIKAVYPDAISFVKLFTVSTFPSN